MHKVYIGISRHPKRFLFSIFFGYATLWTLLEPILAILDFKLTEYNSYYLTLYILLSLLFACINVYPKSKIKFEFKNTNTKVEIKFGDLFQSDGHKVISANEFFDSEIGVPVAQKSVQGIFISKILGGHRNLFDNEFDNQLRGQHTEVITQKLHGNKNKYKLGTTFTLSHGSSIYFVFALTHSDINCNARCTPSDMLEALDGLWTNVRLKGNGEDINLPLIGNGLSRIGLPPSQLLQLILISLLKSVKERDLSSTVRIILLDDMFEKIDLEIIKNNWK